MEKDCCMGCVYFYREAPYEITEEDKFDDRIPNDYRRDGMGTCHRWPPLAAELSTSETTEHYLRGMGASGHACSETNGAASSRRPCAANANQTRAIRTPPAGQRRRRFATVVSGRSMPRGTPTPALVRTRVVT